MSVMYSGRVVEEGKVSQVFANPRHPYTRSLLQSIPRLDTPVDADLMTIRGQPPLPGTIREGCAFESRCFLGRGRVDCLRIRPELQTVGKDVHLSACHFHESLEETALSA